MPRSADCPPSQRNATTARASRTWWLSVPTRRWRPALRTNPRLPRPSVQGLRPTSTLQRRRSTPALLRWRGPPPPQRSPTPEAPGPRGGGNAENDPQGPVLSALTSDPRFSCQSRTPEAPPPHPPTSSTSHLKKNPLVVFFPSANVHVSNQLCKANGGAFTPPLALTTPSFLSQSLLVMTV